LLYQVATGSLSPGEIAAPLRGVLSKQKNTQVLLGEAVDVDPQAKSVILRDGASFEYDSLIVATGTQTSYYGNDFWRQWAPSLKSVEEATAIRHKILYAFERAERTKSESDRNGRIKVNRDLTIPNFPDIFIIGDLAHAVDEKGAPLPGVAQVAMQGGAYAARVLRAHLEGKREPPPFHYFNKGEMAVIGRAAAVANIFGVHLSGLVAWLMWLF